MKGIAALGLIFGFATAFSWRYGIWQQQQRLRLGKPHDGSSSLTYAAGIAMTDTGRE